MTMPSTTPPTDSKLDEKEARMNAANRIPGMVTKVHAFDDVEESPQDPATSSMVRLLQMVALARMASQWRTAAATSHVASGGDEGDEGGGRGRFNFLGR